MPITRKVAQTTRGQTDLVWPGHVAPGSYEIAGDPLQIRGREQLRGCFTTTVELAALAFRERHARMTINGRQYRVVMIAHTAGEPRVWFELMI